MRVGKLGPLGLVAAAILLASPLAAPADAAARAIPVVDLTPRAAPDGLGKDVQVRSDLGLRSDLAYIRLLHQRVNQGLVPGAESESLSVLATPEEIAEINTREQVSHQDGQAIDGELATASASTFAGDYLDNASGKFVVLTTGDPAQERKKVEGLLAHPGRVEFRKAAFAVMDLQSERSRVKGISPADWAALQVDVTSLSIDIVRNRLLVGVRGDATAAAQRLASRLDARKVAVRSDAGDELVGTTANNSPPFRAGQIVSNTTHSLNCTMGPVMVRSGNSGLPPTYFNSTAGHCGLVGDHLSQAGTNAGSVGQSVFNARGDALSASISSANRSHQLVLSGTTYRTMTSTEGQAADHVGDTVCQTGITSGYVCGTLQETSYDSTITDTFGRRAARLYMRIASFQSQGGDSGGPLFYGGMWKGMMSSRRGSDGHATYCQIADEDYVLGMSPVIS